MDPVMVVWALLVIALSVAGVVLWRRQRRALTKPAAKPVEPAAPSLGDDDFDEPTLPSMKRAAIEEDDGTSKTRETPALRR